jgi:SAM-dependent methyltransferase
MPAERVLHPSAIHWTEAGVYVCPDCKTPLARLSCPACRAQFPRTQGVPVLLPNHPRFKGAADIAATYDSIYREQTNVWENRGRTPAFLDYLGSVLAGFPCSRYLEIGCGEGALLARAPQGERCAIDLSAEALKRAGSRTQASLSIALAERLPFPSDYFDLVVSIGVMEHFLDIDEALREIRRVLKRGGHYIVLTHVTLTRWQRARRKIVEYVFPRPRPLRLLRWATARLKRGSGPDVVRQPIQNVYRIREAQARLEDNGLTVRDVVHSGNGPDVPLDPWAVLFIASKGDQP